MTFYHFAAGDGYKKSSVFFSGKKRATPSVAAAGDTSPSDATETQLVLHL